MNIFVFRGSLPAGLALLCMSMAHGQPAPSQLDLIDVADDLYVIHNVAAPGNVTVLVTDEGVLLVDDKFERDFEGMMRIVRSITDQPVRYIVNTHHHGDHTGSNAMFASTGAEIVASERARAKMVEAGMPGLPVFTMDDRARIHIGGKVVDLMYLGRGHTDGDIVIYLPQYRLLVAGDLFTYGSATPQLIDYAGGGSAKDWTDTLDEILKLDFDTVVPGHGDVTNKAEMRKFRDSTLALRTRAQELIRGGSSREQLEAALRREFGWEDLHLARGLDGLFGELR